MPPLDNVICTNKGRKNLNWIQYFFLFLRHYPYVFSAWGHPVLASSMPKHLWSPSSTDLIINIDLLQGPLFQLSANCNSRNTSCYRTVPEYTVWKKIIFNDLNDCNSANMPDNHKIPFDYC